MSVSPTTRHDFYAPIHKALRFSLANLLLKIGQTDFADATRCAETLEALRRQLALSAGHLRHEEDHIHGPLETRRAGGTRELEAAHRHHDEAFVALEALARRIEAAAADRRPVLGHQLYLEFSKFVAEDFAHMAEEEQVTLPLLQSLFTDEELVAMEIAIVSQLGPEENMAIARLMLPAMNRNERLGFLGMARQAAPPEAFEAMLQFAARPTLPQEDWIHLSEGLGLAA